MPLSIPVRLVVGVLMARTGPRIENIEEGHRGLDLKALMDR